MRFSMLYSGEQILSFKSCLVFYAGDSLRQPAFDSEWHFRKSVQKSFVKVWQIQKFHFETEQEENF